MNLEETIRRLIDRHRARPAQNCYERVRLSDWTIQIVGYGEKKLEFGIMRKWHVFLFDRHDIRILAWDKYWDDLSEFRVYGEEEDSNDMPYQTFPELDVKMGVLLLKYNIPQNVLNTFFKITEMLRNNG